MNPPPHNFSALTTDLYEVTMACGYFKAGMAEHEAAFHVTFRENPFAGQFTVACGLATAIDFLRTFQFTAAEINYLSSQRGNDGNALFDSGFLDYLSGLQLTCECRCNSRRNLNFSKRTPDPGSRSGDSMSAHGNSVAHHSEFPKLDRDESGTRPP